MFTGVSEPPNKVPSSRAVLAHWPLWNREGASSKGRTVFLSTVLQLGTSARNGEVPALCVSTCKRRARCHLTRTFHFYWKVWQDCDGNWEIKYNSKCPNSKANQIMSETSWNLSRHRTTSLYVGHHHLQTVLLSPKTWRQSVCLPFFFFLNVCWMAWPIAVKQYLSIGKSSFYLLW